MIMSIVSLFSNLHMYIFTDPTDMKCFEFMKNIVKTVQQKKYTEVQSKKYKVAKFTEICQKHFLHLDTCVVRMCVTAITFAMLRCGDWGTAIVTE